MRLYYDLHIHTALSPCASDDMTPQNIVNMASLKGLDVIAVTDHNSIKNVGAVISAGEKVGITVIAGMEIETAEEVHMLTLFPTQKAAFDVWETVDKNLPKISNNKEIFGNQLIMDENDNIIDEENRLLITATSLSLQSVFSLVKDAGGVAIPAHIDRRSNSIISNLGFIPEDLDITAVEFSCNFAEGKHLYPNQSFDKYKAVFNSDAHHLGAISEKTNFIDVFDNKPENIIRFFG
ncbi:MAG: PHP domain-containing protein [Firmicutes bacterium]|nr:PHP domain-containing protein [Bacillota bacterium]